jgi:serine protease AprX
MKVLFFLLTLLFVFSLISSLSYQYKPVIKPELKKIDPELMELKSSKPQEKVKVIVWMNENKSIDSLKRIGKVKYQYNIIPAVAMEIPVSELENLARESNVEKIVLDRMVSAFRLDSIPLIKADNASSSFSVNGTSINISIIDTGIFNHTEFQSPNRIIKQKCYCSSGTERSTPCCPPGNTNTSDNATDDSGHGTHCAGIAAGKGDSNGQGVAANASLFIVKVLDSSGSGYSSDVVAGIDWAVSNESQVISLSLGSYLGSQNCYDSPVSEAVDNATKLGVVVIVAAGNAGYSTPNITAPGCAKRVITVGATNDNDQIASFSSGGPTKDNRTKPDLTAPGVGIVSTKPSGITLSDCTAQGDNYMTCSGTSMATPHVAGVVALLIQKFKQINGYYPNPDRVKAILITAVNTTGMNASFNYTQRNNIYGSGRIDAYEALRIINYTKNNTISETLEHHYKVNVTSSDFKTTLYWPEDKDTNNDLNLFVGNGSYNYSYPTHANDSIEQVFLMNASTGFWDVYVIGVTGTDQVYYLASNMNITDDVTAPALLLVKPENTTYTSQTNIPLNFTTDETNHTIWYKLDDGNEINITHNTTFNVSSDGFHYITLYVNDSYNNINQSTQYFSVDSTPPIITIISPNSTTVSNYTTKTIWFNISLSETGNVSLYSIDALGNLTMNRSNNTYFYNQSNVTEGGHNVTFYVNDTNGLTNSSSVNFTVSINPVISNQTVDKSLVLLNEGVNISASVSEDTLAFALVNLTWPDGNYTSKNMTNSSSLYYYLFNDTNQTGIYYILVYVNDTLSNRANASSSFEVGQAVNVSSQITNGTAAINVTIKVLYNGTDQIRNQTTNTSLGFVLPSGLWDIKVNTSQLNITLYNSNFTQNITRQINISDDVYGNFTSNVYAIKTVAAKFENFSFSLVNLSFSFNSSIVTNSSVLELYRCSDWNFINSNCSVVWTNDSYDAVFNGTIGTSNVTIVSLNLSAFSLGETQTTTTTTTTTPAETTTVASSSGSSSGNVTTSTTTIVTTTTTSSTTSPATTTSPLVTTNPSITTTVSTKKEITSVQTAWYLVLIPVFALIGFIIWFIFLRKSSVDEFKKLKEKWSG